VDIIRSSYYIHVKIWGGYPELMKLIFAVLYMYVSRTMGLHAVIKCEFFTFIYPSSH